MPRGLVLGFDKTTKRPVYMDDAARATSLHIVGAPGTGKTKLIEHLIRADIRDPAGDTVARIAVTWRLSPPQ